MSNKTIKSVSKKETKIVNKKAVKVDKAIVKTKEKPTKVDISKVSSKKIAQTKKTEPKKTPEIKNKVISKVVEPTKEVDIKTTSGKIKANKVVKEETTSNINKREDKVVKNIKASTKVKSVKIEDKKEIKNEPPIERVKVEYTEPSYGDKPELNYDDVCDDADIASILEMGFIAKALAEHKNKVAPETHPDFDGLHCIDCDEEIPELRLKMGRMRCVHCQSELELKNKLSGRK